MTCDGLDETGDASIASMFTSTDIHAFSDLFSPLLAKLDFDSQDWDDLGVVGRDAFG